MRGTVIVRLLTVPAVLLLLLALPLQSYAGKAHAKKAACKTAKVKTHRPANANAQSVISFGIYGGNIVPWSAVVDGDGSVSTSGWEKARNQKLADSQNTLNGLFKLADAEGFFTMPSRTSCVGTNPDVATRYIKMDSGSGAYQVAAHGTCVQNFNQLYAALENAVDLQH